MCMSYVVDKNEFNKYKLQTNCYIELLLKMYYIFTQ